MYAAKGVKGFIRRGVERDLRIKYFFVLPHRNLIWSLLAGKYLFIIIG